MLELNSEALDFRAASESFAPVRKQDQCALEMLSLVTKYLIRKGPAVGGNGFSIQEPTAAIERAPRATLTRLAKLVERGLVREIGASPQVPKRRYFRAR